MSFLAAAARERGVSAYVGDGSAQWSAVHRSDAARLIRLGLERAEAGTRLHAVAEEAVSTRAIAESLGRALGLPVTSVAPEDADEHFGFVGAFFAMTMAASSVLTRAAVGWEPTGPTLVAYVGCRRLRRLTPPPSIQEVLVQDLRAPRTRPFPFRRPVQGTTTSPVPQASVAAIPPSGRRPTRERAVLACVCACTILVVGFVASVNLAVPALAASPLQPTSSELLWIVDAYVVLFACLVVPAGALGDRVGRKGVLLAGLGVFAAGSLLSALAGDVGLVLAGRALTGVGAACVLPNGLAVLVHATSPARRPRVLATWAAMSGLGGLVGNVVGGAVLGAGSWRWLFAVVAPASIACAAWAARVAPRSPRRARGLDPAGTVLLTVASLALFVAIIQGPEVGWGSAVVVGAFGASAVLFVAWAIVELRVAEPLLDPRLFALPRLRAACLGMLIVFFGMFGLFFVNASLLQYVHGFTVLAAGLGVAPSASRFSSSPGSSPAWSAGSGRGSCWRRRSSSSAQEPPGWPRPSTPGTRPTRAGSSWSGRAPRSRCRR
ncbi:hypothetical protein GCM10025864_14120 [Luteimicrobium album]|uniref:Major facilitator superfamily (MFS) profile domain-containing protein n=1 Tax=Luteimicrobium album TaxID=1054550 RepID=A0ABQ6HYS3_9MICO|nr:MFS transporter [Luteimicrobium album]GMA23653.1 hypothetical protein GCM10025864_14120 [Luteimicrobium album]